jgi:osmotically-inducible protein OsmY
MTDVSEPGAFEGPPPHASRDEIIARLVFDELFWDSRVDASKVQIEVSDGVVVLTGHTPTYADRYAAQADAELIEGVVEVKNRIEVAHPKIVPDVELAQNVTDVLVWTPDVDASDIEVTAHEGAVTLKGCVRLYWEKLRAHLLAARVDGVIHVVDELAVTPTESVTDHEIAEALMQALARRLHEDVHTVQATVKDGAATLRGAVANSALVRAVQDVAEHTTGVVAVHNELTFPHPREIER